MLKLYLDTYFNRFVEFVPTILLAAFTFLVGFAVINYVAKLFSKALDTNGMEPTVRKFLSNILSIGLKMMLLLNIASMFGIQTTSFVAIFAALTFAIGTALSGSLGHFASGVMLLTIRPYKVGDLVTLAAQTGTVEEVGVFNTILLTPDNKKISIPNGQVVGGIITNISGQGELRVDTNFLVDGSQDFDKVKEVLISVANDCPTILHDKKVEVYLQSIPVGMMDIAVRSWSKSEHYWDTYYYMQEQVKRTFDKQRIAFPKK